MAYNSKKDIGETGFAVQGTVPETKEELSDSNITRIDDNEEKEQSAEKVDLFEELDILYNLRNNKGEKVIKEAEAEIKISDKGVRDVLHGVKGIASISYKDRHDLLSDRNKIEARIRELEYNALEVPENKEGEELNIRELEKESVDYIREVEETTEKIIEDLGSEREKFVKEFIEESVEDVLNHFESDINGTKNRINAKEIISLKTEKEIELAAKRFIETGDKADFGFTATLEVSSYRTVERGVRAEKKFVTGFIIKVGGHEKKVRENDRPRGKNLMPGSERVKRDNTRREGGIIKKENIK